MVRCGMSLFLVVLFQIVIIKLYYFKHLMFEYIQFYQFKFMSSIISRGCITVNNTHESCSWDDVVFYTLLLTIAPFDQAST